MQLASRPYATAGVAIVGAGLIAVTPVAAPLPDIHVMRDVALTADAWTDAFNTASADATQLINNYFLAPGVALQQLIANQAGYAQQLLDDPVNINAVMQQIQQNLAGVLTGYALQNADSDTVSTVTAHTLDGVGLSGHAFLFQELPSFLPSSVDPATVTPIVDFLASPLSGIIMGTLGPAISPWIALINSINDGDSFSDMLANMVGAFFNGADLNLDALLPAINGAGVLPPGMAVQHLDFAFGGLLTPGSVSVGPYEMFGSSGDVTASTPAVGGSIFNSLGVDAGGVPVLGNIDIASQPVGPIGASEAWGQTIGALLGSGWDGKGAVGVTPPLGGVDLPTIPDVDDDGASAAADLSGLLQETITALSG